MKKIITVLLGILVAGPLLASTCQTRVDNKWNKSTQERINTCLFPELEPPAPEKEVIINQVYSVQPPKPKNTNKTTQKVSKTYAKQLTYNEYIDDDHYPKFKNEFMPQPSAQEASEVAMQALEEQRQMAELPDLKAKPAQKPARQVVQAVLPTDQVDGQVYPDELPDTVVPQTDIQTPPAQITQAQDLQNNPVMPSYNDTYTHEFLDDSVMGPSGFGYNSTDPAYQP